jgi:K+-transporting ATPase ATPase C chain
MALSPNQPDRPDTSTTTSTADTAPVDPANQESRETGWRAMVRQFRPAIVLTLLLTLILGIIYPLVTTGVAQAVFPSQANGSLVCVNGKPIGSTLIGQYWTKANYFQGRPSVTVNLAGTPAPYEADNSAGSNLGPTNSVLVQTVQQRIAQLKKENPDVPPGTPIPADLVESTASGLDPAISVAAAYYQIPRIAKARGMSQAAVEHIVNQHIQGRFLGLFGEPFVNVLDLNLALDNITPSSCQ